MEALLVLLHPVRRFPELAERPRLGRAAAAVVASGVVSAGLGVLANALAGGGPQGAVLSLVLPALFLAYWVLEALLVDAAAAMVGRSGRRRDLLCVSGFTFPAWVAYAVLGVGEALALHVGGSGVAVASGLQWATLPVLGWFLALSVLAIRAVYAVTPLSAFAFALLPYAAVTTALLILALVLSALHAAGLV